MTTAPIESVFSRAWQLLTRNPVIVVPGIVIGIVVGVTRALMTPVVVYSSDGSVAVESVMAMAGSGLLLSFIGLIGVILTQGMATAMAAAAWQRGSTTLSDATEHVNELLPTAGGLFVLAIVATLLAFPTLGLALLAYYLFTFYAFPAALIGKAPGFTSIRESFRLTTARFVPTLVVAILIFVIGLVGGLIAGVFHVVPLLGPIVSAVITQIVVAYAMLVIVGEYLALRGAAPTSPFATGSGPYAGGPTSYTGGPTAYPPGPTAYPPGPTAYPPGPSAYTPPTSAYTPPPSVSVDPPTTPPPGGTNL